MKLALGCRMPTMQTHATDFILKNESLAVAGLCAMLRDEAIDLFDTTGGLDRSYGSALGRLRRKERRYAH